MGYVRNMLGFFRRSYSIQDLVAYISCPSSNIGLNSCQHHLGGLFEVHDAIANLGKFPKICCVVLSPSWVVVSEFNLSCHSRDI